MSSQTRTVSTQSSSLDKTLTGILAALAMFVAGYTVVRASLAQPNVSGNTANVVNVVIPHQATLWSDLAE
ncbi:MAG: hypothetical protein AAF821_04020 [Cyanobacteria bacterium P01_D01_bin.156]